VLAIRVISRSGRHPLSSDSLHDSLVVHYTGPAHEYLPGGIMYCPSCGSEITVELKYCSRCGANLSLTPASYPAPTAAPIKLTAPTVVLGLTITGGLGIIFGGASELAQLHLHPAAITWMVIFSLAMLFGCTALLLSFWSKMFAPSRAHPSAPALRTPAQIPGSQQQHLPPRFEPVPSVTEHTTRTFNRLYPEGSDPGAR